MKLIFKLLALTILIIGTFQYEVNFSAHKNILDNFMDKPAKELFKVWHLLFKSHEYSLNSQDAINRYKVFKMNLKLIKAHNSNTLNSWKLGLNQFSDLTEEEFTQKYLMTSTINNSRLGLSEVPINGFINKVHYYNQEKDMLYKPIDWSSFCPVVRDQGACGSCYAFAMIGAIECNYNIKMNNGNFVNLSRQQIIECDPFNNGCRGGDPEDVSVYAVSQGLFTEAEYSYKPTYEPNCQYDTLIKTQNLKPQRYLDGIETLCYDDGWTKRTCQYTSSMYRLIQRGPFTSSIDSKILKNYSSGIINTDSCIRVNHVVIVIGLGNDPVLGNYWIVRNTYGESWGEKGHFRIVANDVQKKCLHQIVRPFLL